MAGKTKPGDKNSKGDNSTAESVSMQDISSILDDYVSETDLGEKLKKFNIFNHWEEIVGKEIGRKARPQKLFREILYISVSDPGWANELSMMSEQLIKKINSYAGRDIVSQLRFKIIR